MAKRIFLLTTFLLYFLCLANSSLAQEKEECVATKFFEENNVCTKNLEEATKCLEVSVLTSVDKDGKEFIYQWDMGDKTSKQGYIINHCYEEYGDYFVVLDLLDPETQLLIRNEISQEVSLPPPIKYKVDTVRKKFVRLEYEVDQNPDFFPNEIFWKIEHSFYCGAAVEHLFENVGLHIVEVGLLNQLPDGEMMVGCMLMGVYVEDKKND